LILALAFPSGAAQAAHLGETTSAAIYRIPYADGTLVDVSWDAHNHGGQNGNRDRIDMVAVDGGGNAIVSGFAAATGPADPGDPAGLIVAAASGIIRVIEDDHGDDYGRGDGLTAGGAAQPDDSLEHLCTNNAVLPANESCARHNNYVWIEHPNGEWSKYSHFRTGTVRTDYGWSEGDAVQVGDILGEEGNVGFAGGTHLHFEIAELGAFTGSLPANIGNPGGFINTGVFQNHNPRVCDSTDADYEYVDDNDNSTTLVAGPCVNTTPVADAGGDVTVDEGSMVQLDGTSSSDIHNATLSYWWSPNANLDDPSSATPVYSAVDDAVEVLTLTVDDEGGDVGAAQALSDSDNATVTVQNVAPTVTATGDSIHEAGTATVSATFSDPGVMDTHTATIDWGDTRPVEAVSPAELASGVSHSYGDDGPYFVTVTVTDDDGGAGVDVVEVTVGNLDPTVQLDDGDELSFPGGSYRVVAAGGPLDGSAHASDVGSDDLIFSWSTGDSTTAFNDGVGPDPLPSSLGTFPFGASHDIVASYPEVGVEILWVIVTDDDGGWDSTEDEVLVTGTAGTTQGSGWWKHQYSGAGSAHADPATLAGYLEVVAAVSSVFSEAHPVGAFEEAHALLSTGGGTARDRAVAELLLAWLHFASGAVSFDATVPLRGQATIDFLELMFAAEETILDPASSKKQLGAVERDLARVRQAF
jgi:hypothetical protein